MCCLTACGQSTSTSSAGTIKIRVRLVHLSTKVLEVQGIDVGYAMVDVGGLDARRLNTLLKTSKVVAIDTHDVSARWEQPTIVPLIYTPHLNTRFGGFISVIPHWSQFGVTYTVTKSPVVTYVPTGHVIQPERSIMLGPLHVTQASVGKESGVYLILISRIDP